MVDSSRRRGEETQIDSEEEKEREREREREGGGEREGDKSEEAKSDWRTPSYRSIRTPISPPGRAITAYREWDEFHSRRMG